MKRTRPSPTTSSASGSARSTSTRTTCWRSRGRSHRRQAGKTGRYYVRTPDDVRVFVADVAIDVSTRFRDWIEKDLLELSTIDLRRIVVNQYSVNEELGKIEEGDVSELTRETGSSPWVLKGIDPEQEQVKSSVIAAMGRALANLQIVGIRRKPAALVQFFTDGAISDVQRCRSSRICCGTASTSTGDLFANEGEVEAGTQDGVSYTLRFGEVFTGSDLAVEVGDDDASASAEAGSDAEDTADADGSRNRYVIVEAMFDESLLGPKPAPPTKPTPPGEAPNDTPAADPASDAASQPAPEGEPTNPEPPATVDQPAAADESPATGDAPEATTAETPDDANCDDGAETETESTTETETAPAAETEPTTPAAEPAAPAGGTSTEESPAAETTAPNPEPQDDAAEAAAPATPATSTPPVIRERTANDDYDAALKQYEVELKRYEVRIEEYNKRVTEGRARVKRLNDRFAEWYYVIPADVFEELRVSRAQLVEPKSAAGEAPAAGGGAFPGGLPFELPGIPGIGPRPQSPAGDAAPVESTEASAPAGADEAGGDPAANGAPSPATEPAEPGTPADTDPAANPSTEDAPEAESAVGNTDDAASVNEKASEPASGSEAAASSNQ
ncbi:MAG: DUF4340 domain-containing protein [Planctomycetaceae bacterium]